MISKDIKVPADNNNNNNNNNNTGIFMGTTSYPVFLTGSGRGCVPKTSIALHGFRSADK
jgi:hypothetical protein